MYHLGEGVPIDFERAEHYYGLAADMENPSGLNNLGVLKNFQGDEEKGRGLIERAAAAGHDGAIYNRAMTMVKNQNHVEALKMFRYLSARGIVIGVHMLARMLLVSNVIYDPKQAAEWLERILVLGPWVKLGKTAEEYWKAGNHAGAALLWMELADCGMPDAAFNAGFVLLKSEKFDFMTADQQSKLARIMFKRLHFLTHEDVTEYIVATYDNQGKGEKAKDVLTEMSSSSASFYRLAEAHLDGRIAFRLRSIIGNLSLAIDNDGAFVVPAMTLTPRLVLGVAKQLRKCASIGCNEDEIDDLRNVFLEFCKSNSSTVACLVTLMALIVLVRKRVARCFESS
jgi:TPR repeat protein